MSYRIFISSVQREFAKERKALAAMIRKDLLLKTFFEPFIFEESSACNRSAKELYLDEVRECDVYLVYSERSTGMLIRSAYLRLNANTISPRN